MINIARRTSWIALAQPSLGNRFATGPSRTPRTIAFLLACAAGLSSTPVSAQGIPGSVGSASSSSLSGGTIIAQGLTAPAPIINAAPRASTTILPTDVLPLPTIQNRMSFGENLQLRVLQKLPARFYFSSSTETSWRLETNVFQFPTKRVLMRKLGITPEGFRTSSLSNQQSILNTLKLASSQDQVFRVLPNVTAGWTLTPRTRLYGNYFMIRDSLCKNVRLNTVIHSYGYGIQQDIPIGTRANLQADLQFRELNQMHQHSVFDFLPGLTLSVVATPRTVLFVNALAQIRGRKYFQAPTREIDPFYTWGLLHQRGGWTFSASTTFVQNFREPFHHHASIPVNNYAFISDFEIARRIVRQLPGLQAFVRAEPIWNFHSHNRPGLAGMDFRCYFGLRFAMSKPALTSALESLRRQLEEQEVTPPTPQKPGPKPSAFVAPEEVTAQSPQPIHGFLPEANTASGSGDLKDSLLTAHGSYLMPPQQSDVYPVTVDSPLVPVQASVQDQIAEDEGSPVQLVAGEAPREQ